MSRPLKVLYYGNYVPLHGVRTILAATDELRGHQEIRLLLIGDGPGRPEAEIDARSLDLEDVAEFLAPVPEQKLIDYILDADIVLGVFGTSDKASSVIPNKVWQGLAAGKRVLTRRSDALGEIESIVGHQLIQVEPDSPSLARALRDPSLLESQDSRQTATLLELYVQAQFRAAFSPLLAAVENA